LNQPEKLYEVRLTFVEILHLKLRTEFDLQKDYVNSLATAKEMVSVMRDVCAFADSNEDNKSNLAYYIYLQGRSMERVGESKTECLIIQNEAVKIEESIN